MVSDYDSLAYSFTGALAVSRHSSIQSASNRWNLFFLVASFIKNEVKWFWEKVLATEVAYKVRRTRCPN